MRRLFPVTDQTAENRDREWTLDDLAEAYAYPPLADEQGREPATDLTGPAFRPAEGSADDCVPCGPGADADHRPDGVRAGAPSHWLRANMVSTLDGAAQHEGRSQPISCATDMRIFGTLRALADVVVVGAQTVRQEGYRPARAREAFAARRAAAGQGPAAAIAVVSAGLDLDLSLPLFASALVPSLVLTGAGAPGDRVAAARRAGVEVVFAGEGVAVDPERAVKALGARGYRRQLTEGGPRLLGQFIAASVVDELCLTLSPMLTAGSAQRIAGGPALAVPERLGLVSVLEEAGFLYSRYRRI
ncbi:pyrimidine reductase family protein [Streptomyces sp. NPDC006879]|uniref:pyrimidine reductase family protein n=1 Tax=Streptomyces sp. NPDC006879 TaxID=3364767 RepID=UPI0036C6695D